MELTPSRRTARRFAVLYFVVGSGALLLGGISADAEMSVASVEGAWVQLAIFVLFSAFIAEPHFPGGGTPAMNALVIIFLNLAVEPPHLVGFWNALLALAVISLVANVVSYGMADGSRHIRRQRALAALARRTGGWRALILPALALALATFNTPFDWEWGLGTAAASYALLIAGVRPHELFGPLFGRSAAQAHELWVLAIFPPNEVLVTGAPNGTLAPGVGLLLRGASGTAEAIITHPAFFGGARCWRAVAPSLHAALSSMAVTDPLGSLEVSIHAPEETELKGAHREIVERGADCIGLLSEGSRVRSALIELASGISVDVGEVLWVLKPEGRTYWQVMDTEVRRSSWAGDARRVLAAEAAQIGRWEPRSLGFAVDTSSPEPSALLFRGGQPPEIGEVDGSDNHVVGHLVGSTFPVVVNLSRLGRQHAAILGTTGTGKTHLAFELAVALSAAGTRVICVDQTGQYSARFPHASVLRNVGDAGAFLDGADPIAVLTPHDADPITVVNTLARGLLRRFRGLGAVSPDAPARCAVMIDEAHNFVPEAFVIDDWGLKAKSQDTSMVLMESRKFGLGFILISQRTAMVTKSALSQCNSIFAFQAVDQTGLDYLEGLCGRTYASALPTLPHRRAILMGQALASNAPVIAYINDASVVVP